MRCRANGPGIALRNGWQMKRVQVMKKAGFLCLLTILTLFSGCGGGKAALPDDQGRSIAEAFLAEIRTGKVEGAWQGTTAEFKSLMGRESFMNYVRKQPSLKAETKFQSARPLENGNMKLVECTFGADKPKAAVVKVILAAGPEKWQVERLSVE